MPGGAGSTVCIKDGGHGGPPHGHGGPPHRLLRLGKCSQSMNHTVKKISVELIVFDLDGTLVDSLADLTKAANFCCRRLGLPGHTLEDVMGMIGGGERKFLEGVVGAGHEDLIPPCLGLYLEYYHAHCGDLTRPYPGVRETLEQLARTKKLAVLSNKLQSLTECVLEVLGLARFFTAVRGGGPVLPLKPSPEPLMAILREVGADPARTLMVGDKPVDVVTGRGAGTFTVGVTYGYGAPESLVAAAPDFLLEEISQLPEIIE